jgi:hypothetical protein
VAEAAVSADLPRVLFRTRRGLCPACGTPLELDDDVPEVTCRFCGSLAVLERRLRKVEPEVAGAPLRLYLDAAAAEAGGTSAMVPWVRSKGYRQSNVERTVCPGCGDALEWKHDAERVDCPSCGSDCRLERRLWAPLPDPERAVPRRRDPDERQAPEEEDDDPRTEQLVFRFVSEADPSRRVALAIRFEEWAFVNATAARLLPSLLRVACESGPVLQVPIADFIGKLLCEGRAELRNATLRAIEPFVFERAVPPALLFALGLGDGTGLKVLLDAAELAHRRGDDDTATTALLAVNWIFQRNFPHHTVMGEILLHRMLYLSGPALAFALLLARRKVTGTGFHYRAETLLAFIDEAAVERPELVPELARCFYVGLPKDEAECRQRLAFFGTLRTAESRAAALREFLLPPEDGPEEFRRALEVLVPDHGPSLSSGAEEPPLSPELQALLDRWDDDLRRAVGAVDAARATYREFRKSIAGLQVPLFDVG